MGIARRLRSLARAAAALAGAVLVLAAPTFGQSAETPDAEKAVFDDGWFYDSWNSGGKREQMEGRPAPGLFLDGFANGNPLANGGLAGKIVLLDFWATWCGPCLKAIPDTNALALKYAGDGVVVLGVCTSTGQEKFGQVVNQYGIRYPVARDPGERTKQAWRISSYPSLALVDRNGVVRAIGLTTRGAGLAISELLKEQPEPGKAASKAALARLDGSHLEGDADRRAAMAEHLEGRTMPALSGLKRWSNARDIRNGRTLPEGTRLVVVSFLTAGDTDELDRLATLNAMEGVVAIGVLTDAAWADARPMMQAGDRDLPLAYDPGGQIAALYGVDAGEPEAYLIAPDATVLAGDVANKTLADAVAALLDTE